MRPRHGPSILLCLASCGAPQPRDADPPAEIPPPSAAHVPDHASHRMGPPARVVVRVVEVPPFAPATVWHDIGIFVRSRESQLRFCYVEMGLKLDPALTGQVTATMALRQDGRVEAVALEPAPGGWHGPAADGVQACVRNRIRSWRFPAGIAGSHRVALDFRLDPLAR